MVSEKYPKVALLSIKPRFVEKILSGEKQIEFRKIRMNTAVSHIIMYATYPRQEIMGFFEVAGFDEGNPAELWQRYSKVGGIEEFDYWTYYNSNRKGFAIRIGRVFTLKTPHQLRDLMDFASVPQSFCYVERKIIDRLFKLITGE
ncbi:hypothetical protein KAX97_08145 [candidate division WOR-3 bacterium]|nr:hypothetical protein [candidate division WOR-3 bacterium]